METFFGIGAAVVFFLVVIAIGAPVWWGFFASTLIALVLIGSPMGYVVTTVYQTFNNYILMAVGFFIFAGSLMAEAGVADALIRLARALVARVRGGLVDVGIVAVLFLSSLTGSSVPTIAATIPLLVPQLEKLGYERRYVTAVLCSSSFLGYLIPPSVPVLIYCFVAQQSVAAVFLATVFPGLLLAGGYMVVNHFISPRYMHPTGEIAALPTTFKGTVKEVAVSTWLALPAIGCPILILGGIYGGLFTPNEAGAVAVVYTIPIGMFVYRKMTLKSVGRCSGYAAGTLGMFMILVGFGVAFSRLLVREGVAGALAESVLGMFDEKYLVLLMLNLFVLVAGMFIDGLPIMIIVVPLIMPLIEVIGVNLVHLGAIIVVNVGLGVVTPPYAISIFAGSRLADVPYTQLVKPMMIFLLFVGLPVLFLTTYIPWLSCWLPTLAVGSKMVGPW